MDKPYEIILFDGVCTLCSRSVQFVIRRDANERFRFCALQSDAGQELLRLHGLPPADFDSLVLISGEACYQRSDAVLRICAGLSPPWRWMHGLRIFPRPARDALYRLVARRRYRWFGRRESCLVPTDAVRNRFIVQGPPDQPGSGEQQ